MYIILIMVVFIIGIILYLAGKSLQNKKLLNLGKILSIAVLLCGFMFTIYPINNIVEEIPTNKTIVKSSVNSDSKLEVEKNLPVPDRIIYKNDHNKYIVIDSHNDNFSSIYTELNNRLKKQIDGKVFSEEEINNKQDKGSFIECDYNSISKNYIFMFDEEEIGIIKRQTDTAQVIQTTLENKQSLKNTIEKLTKYMNEYDFKKDKNYTSTTKLNDIPKDLDFVQKKVGIYQMQIDNDETNFDRILELLEFETNQTLPEVDFEKENVIITISAYDINSIKENIGNIKYEFGKKNNNYQVNVLIISKIVNTNCIYYNTSDNILETDELSNMVNITANGIIKSVSEDKIEVGLSDEVITYIANINKNTYIIDYETQEEIQISDLENGDLIYISGEVMHDINDVKAIDSNKIVIFSKEKAKQEIEKEKKNKNTMWLSGIEYINIDENGNGYIIVVDIYEKFIYPITLRVDSSTQTFLGTNNNYGYVLHEMCDITLSEKIDDIDNILGVVEKIEYIAD